MWHTKHKKETSPSKTISIIHFSKAWGGSEEYIVLLIKACLENGLSVRLILLHRSASTARFQEKLRIYEQQANFQIWRVKAPLKNLCYLVKRLRGSSCLHFHRVHDLWLLAILKLCLPETKMIFSAHNNINHRLLSSIFWDGLITNSELTLQSLKPQLSTKCHRKVIYPVVLKDDLVASVSSCKDQDQDADDNDSSELINIPSGKPLLLMGANLHKNQPELVEILALVKEQIPEAHLCFACPNFRAEAPENLLILKDAIAKYELQGMVSIFLNLARGKYLQLLKACDMFVYTFPYEPFGLVLLEAALLNKPIIAYKFAFGAEELMSKYGHYHPIRDGDRQGFMTQIYQCWQELKTQNLKPSFNEDLYQLFAYEHFARESIQFYLDLLPKK